MRGDGVDAGPAFDDAGIVGGFRLLGNLEVGDGGDDACQAVDGAGCSEGSIGMAPWTTNGDAPALGADGDVCDVAKTSIDGDDRTQLLAVAFNGGACAEEVAQTFLAHVGNGDDIGLGLSSQFIEDVKCSKHSSNTQAVVPNARTAQDVRVPLDRDGCCLWKDGVGVGQQQQDRALLALAAPGVDVAGGVDFRAIAPFSPARPPVVREPARSLSARESRRCAERVRRQLRCGWRRQRGTGLIQMARTYDGFPYT